MKVDPRPMPLNQRLRLAQNKEETRRIVEDHSTITMATLTKVGRGVLIVYFIKYISSAKYMFLFSLFKRNFFKC